MTAALYICLAFARVDCLPVHRELIAAGFPACQRIARRHNRGRRIEFICRLETTKGPLP